MRVEGRASPPRPAVSVPVPEPGAAGGRRGRRRGRRPALPRAPRCGSPRSPRPPGPAGPPGTGPGPRPARTRRRDHRRRDRAGRCGWSATSTTTRSGGTPRASSPSPGCCCPTPTAGCRTCGPRSSWSGCTWTRPGGTRTTSSCWPRSTTSSRTSTPTRRTARICSRFIASGRIEIVGGSYNEPNTNLTCAESTIRNAVYGLATSATCSARDPQTAWMLDAFGHDPGYPGLMAAAGLTESGLGPGAVPPVGAAPHRRRQHPDAVRQRVRVDVAGRPRPADRLHGQPLRRGLGHPGRRPTWPPPSRPPTSSSASSPRSPRPATCCCRSAPTT